MIILIITRKVTNFLRSSRLLEIIFYRVIKLKLYDRDACPTETHIFVVI